MRYGVLGGSFNPVHIGHLKIVQFVRERLSLDKVFVVVAGIPPHKPMQELVSFQHRLRMCELAFEGFDFVEVLDMEGRRGGLSYTIDTLKSLTTHFPQAVFFFIIGADSLHELPTWRKIHQIVELVEIVPITREGFDPSDAESLKKFVSPEKIESIKRNYLDMPPMTVSGTLIRERIRSSKPVSSLLPPPVAEYIKKQKLYIG